MRNTGIMGIRRSAGDMTGANEAEHIAWHTFA